MVERDPLPSIDALSTQIHEVRVDLDNASAVMEIAAEFFDQEAPFGPRSGRKPCWITPLLERE